MKLVKFIPILLLLFLGIVAYFTGLGSYLSFDYLKSNRSHLVDYISKYPFFAALVYIAIYTLLVAISFPGASFLTIIGGFLFDKILGTIYTVLAATLGACIIFLAARYALKDIKNKLGKWFVKIERGFAKNGPWYLLFLRLIPLFPFWAINIAPAALPVSLFTYFWTTLLGIIPGTFVYVQAGAGLGAIFDTHERFSVDTVFNWEIRIALFFMALLALLPILVKKWREKSDR